MHKSRGRNRRLLGLGLAVLAVLSPALAACSSDTAASSSESSAESADGNLIGVSLYTNQVARFNFEEQKMKEVAAANGDEVISNFSNNSLETQLSQIDSMIQRGIKVLVLNQVNSKAFAPVVAKAQARASK